MKYHDSINEAEQLMALCVEQLKQWCLPISPINYAVCYEYQQRCNNSLVQQVEQQITNKGKLDGFFMESVFKEHVLAQSQFRDEIIFDLNNLLSIARHSNAQSSSSAQHLITELDDNIPQLRSVDKTQVNDAIEAIQLASQAFKQQQAQIAQQLKQVEQENKALADELAKARQEIYLDPVTGLFNEKSVAQHIKQWRANNENCQVFAIVIKVNKFSDFVDNFGALLSDVIIAKIAHKVASYVDDSGLPIRASYDEFVLLLPDIDLAVAKEIGKKVVQGVDKLRFVSSKSETKLPKVTINFTASELANGEHIKQLLQRTRQLLS